MITLDLEEVEALRLLLSDDDHFNAMSQSSIDMIESGEWQVSKEHEEFIRRVPTILGGLRKKLIALKGIPSR